MNTKVVLWLTMNFWAGVAILKDGPGKEIPAIVAFVFFISTMLVYGYESFIKNRQISREDDSYEK